MVVDDEQLIKIMKDAIRAKADENGLALVASIGVYIKSLQAVSLSDLLHDIGYQKLAEFIDKHVTIFDYYQDGIEPYSAACLRLKHQSL
jgi:hypothetical protein